MKSIDTSQFESSADFVDRISQVVEAGEKVIAITEAGHVLFYMMSPKFVAENAASAVAGEIMRN